MNTVVSVFGIRPTKIGSSEAYARELSLQLDRHGWKSVLCFASEPAKSVIDYLNLPNVEIEIVHEPWHVRMRTVAEFVRVLKRHRPGVLHLHYTGFRSPYPWLAKLHSVEKVFFTDHTSQRASCVPSRAAYWKRMLTRVINYPISGVICVSRFGYNFLTRLDLLPTDRFILIYNSVDLDRAKANSTASHQLRLKYSIPETRSLVIQVSWIIPEKGIVDLLKAARLVLDRDQNVHFLIVGEGSFRERYTELAKEMGLEDRITWTGLVEDPFREGIFAAADIVCQVSRWQELFGFTIAEAMAFQKPVVATRVGGIPEIVQDGVTGFLVPAQSPEQIAEKLFLLLENEELRERMGRAGYAKVAANFEIRKNVAQVLDVYGVPAGCRSVRRPAAIVASVGSEL